jgi:hypothetical protein
MDLFEAGQREKRNMTARRFPPPYTETLRDHGFAMGGIELMTISEGRRCARQRSISAIVRILRLFLRRWRG